VTKPVFLRLKKKAMPSLHPEILLYLLVRHNDVYPENCLNKIVNSMNNRLNTKAILVVAVFFSALPFGFTQVDLFINQSNPDYILFEAEDFSDRYRATDGNSRWDPSDEGIRSSGTAASSDLLAAKVVYKLNLLVGGNYTMYVRYRTDNDNDDASFYIPNEAGSLFGIGKIETTGLATYQWFNVVRITGFTLDDEQSLPVFPDIEGVTIDKILLHKNGSLDVGMIDDMGLTPSPGQQSSPAGLFAYAPVEDNTTIFELDRNSQGSVMDAPRTNQKYFPFNGSTYYTLNGVEGVMSFTFPDIGCFKNLATGEFLVSFWWMSPNYLTFSNEVEYTLNVTKMKGSGTTQPVSGTISNTTIASNGYRYNKVVISSKALDLSGKITGASLFIEVKGANLNDLIWIDHITAALVDDGGKDPFVAPIINSLGVITTEGSPTINFGADITGDIKDVDEYYWDFGDGTTAALKKNVTSHTYMTAGTFTVTLTILNNGPVSGNSPSCRLVRINAIRSEVVIIPESVFLPVELKYFKGEVEEKGILLSWSTAVELNNDYFAIEHSRDAIEFTSIAQVQGAGTTQITQEYSFLHERPQKGWHYYRLRQVDFDGTTAYSKVVPIRWETGYEPLSVYPNPSAQHLEVRGLLGPARVLILDVQGRVLKQYSVGPHNRIDISSLNRGMYIARIFEQVAPTSTNLRFVKK
jgi:PKD repeat protein